MIAFIGVIVAFVAAGGTFVYISTEFNPIYGLFAAVIVWFAITFVAIMIDGTLNEKGGHGGH